MDNELSGSEHDFLSQRSERANVLVTLTVRHLVMKCKWSCLCSTRLAPSTASIHCLCDCTVILTVCVLSLVLEV